MANDKDKSKSKQLPWEDKWGNPLPTQELEKISKSWSPTQWEEYLQSLEGNLKEKLGNTLDEGVKQEVFARRGDEQFEKNAEYDLAQAYATEAEQTHYLESLIVGAEEKAYQKVADAKDDDEKRRAAVELSLQFLTASERFVIERYFWDGLTEEDIARLMKKRRSTIQTWKKRALTKLYKILSSILPIKKGSPLTQPVYQKPRLRLKRPLQTKNSKVTNTVEVLPVQNIPLPLLKNS